MNRAQRRAQRPQSVILAVHLPRSTSSWARDDREWFEANRDRSHRVRPRFPNEWLAEPADAEGLDLHLVAVRQIEPGMRTRVSFTLPASPWLERFRAAATTEAGAHALFDLTQQGRDVSCAGVEAWLARYVQGGLA